MEINLYQKTTSYSEISRFISAIYHHCDHFMYPHQSFYLWEERQLAGCVYHHIWNIYLLNPKNASKLQTSVPHCDINKTKFWSVQLGKVFGLKLKNPKSQKKILDKILTKKFFRQNFFSYQNFFWPKYFWTKIFS